MSAKWNTKEKYIWNEKYLEMWILLPLRDCFAMMNAGTRSGYQFTFLIYPLCDINTPVPQFERRNEYFLEVLLYFTLGITLDDMFQVQSLLGGEVAKLYTVAFTFFLDTE